MARVNEVATDVDDLPGAIVCMERMIARENRTAIGHFNLGCYLALLGEKERALEEITMACGLEESYRALAPKKLVAELDG